MNSTRDRDINRKVYTCIYKNFVFPEFVSNAVSCNVDIKFGGRVCWACPFNLACIYDSENLNSQCFTDYVEVWLIQKLFFKLCSQLISNGFFVLCAIYIETLVWNNNFSMVTVQFELRTFQWWLSNDSESLLRQHLDMIPDIQTDSLWYWEKLCISHSYQLLQML